MEKLNHDLDAAFGEIHVPDEELNKRVQHALEIAQKQHRKRARRFQAWKGSLAAILVIGIISVLASSFLSQHETTELTSSAGFEDNILYQHGDKGIKLVVTEGKATELNLEQESNDIQLKLTEAFLDEGRLVIGYKVLSKEEQKGTMVTNLSYQDKDLGVTVYSLNKLEPNKEHTGIFSFDVSDLPDEVNFELNVRYEEWKKPKAEWDFQFDLINEGGYLVKGMGLEKQNKEGAKFRVATLEETASKLEIQTNLFLPEQISTEITNNMHLNYIIIGKQSGGYYLADNYFTMSSNDEFLERIRQQKSYPALAEFAPLRNVESYQIIPIIADYTPSNVIREPLVKGKGYHTVNGTFQVIKVMEKNNSLVVTIDKGNIPHELIGSSLQLEDKENTMYQPTKYKVKGKYVELYYQTTIKPKDLGIFYVPAKYYFDDLTIDVP
ncbi:hypothetical protein FIU87_01405 [Bacillus sp. THAF10]|uniref:DUF4179 domain-containing protein n=1 Tax=Bacillus sp. THAF10 TaxID=2587848 RepID=UPI0012AA3ACA|nr:DUF4179 domain-containing protein [Bacillus sp. THAF10]QFT87309.1 hypothetical protein FIU87_01405 [Bacillus sp. THAF10]